MTDPNEDGREEARAAVPQLLVEQLALGELDGASAERVRSELGDGAGETLERIAADNAEILSDYPPERVAADIRRRLEALDEPTRARPWAWVLAPTLVAAVALVWVIVDRPEDQTIAEVGPEARLVDDGAPEPTRIKGAVDPHLVIDRRTVEGHERLSEGEVVSEGDVLQVSYVPAGYELGVIVSIDGAGVVTLHHPSAPEDAPMLDEGKEIPLRHAYELDDAPSFERFWFVTRDGQAPSVEAVVRAAEALAANPAKARSQELELDGGGWRQHEILLRKAATGAEADTATPVPANDPANEEAAE